MNVLSILKNGDEKQRKAYQALKQLNILHDLSSYKPLLCGTIPLGINHEQSDLDIVLDTDHIDSLALKLKTTYGKYSEFSQKKTKVRGREVLITNFFFEDFEFELFAQAQNTKEQYGYLHMIIEYCLLQENPEWKKSIRQMKQNGLKTESAFCLLLALKGDPYDELIKYGRAKKYI